MQELPLARKQRFIREHGLPPGVAEVLKDNVALGDLFEAAATGAPNPKALANWIINDLSAKLAGSSTTVADIKFTPAALRELVALVDSGKISHPIAQQVFSDLFADGGSPAAIVEQKGLAQMSDSGAIERMADEVIAANPGPAADFRAGKAAALNFLKGQLMKLSKGKANPGIAGEVLERRLRA